MAYRRVIYNEKDTRNIILPLLPSGFMYALRCDSTARIAQLVVVFCWQSSKKARPNSPENIRSISESGSPKKELIEKVQLTSDVECCVLLKMAAVLGLVQGATSLLLGEKSSLSIDNWTFKLFYQW